MEIKFGTSGIRGLSMVDISPELCHRVSKALAIYYGEGSCIALGYDTRPHAKELAGYCANVFRQENIEVHNHGVISSPGICASILMNGYDGGLILTGSHIPYDRIGLIPLDGDGTIPPRSRSERIEELARQQPVPEADLLKSVLPEERPLDRDRYLAFIKRIIGYKAPYSNIKISIDPAGATGAGVVSSILAGLGCQVTAIYDAVTDIAPRSMEPRIDTVQDLCEEMERAGSDMGAAFDSDCDRVLFLDENAQPLSEDLAASLFAKYIYGLGPGKKCTTPINSSGLIKKVWQGEVVDCIIGPPEISESIRATNAIFAYEESGKYFFPPEVLWADGIIATAMLVRILSETGRTLSDITAEFPGHKQLKKNVRGTEGQMDYVSQQFRERFDPGEAELLDIDGLKYIYPDGSWLLIRPSGTEPLMRVYVDSPSVARANELSETGLRMVKELMAEYDSKVEKVYEN